MAHPPLQLKPWQASWRVPPQLASFWPAFSEGPEPREELGRLKAPTLQA